MPRASSAVLCRGFLSDSLSRYRQFRIQPPTLSPSMISTTEHRLTVYTLKDFESIAASNNPLSAPKTCDLDPAPTFLVQELADDLLYFLTVLSNSLLHEE